jgi:murein DD-endopeptidase MepM/ murein hydrolase activator NlpD
MSGGIVIATDTSWEPGSILRAGKYIRIFDVTNKCLLYYSHLKSVNKKPGDMVQPGDKIGEVGRTGRSMILSDGQTHLHIALLKIENGYPVPKPLIDELRRTEEKRKE